jgi:hypothetical protein
VTRPWPLGDPVFAPTNGDPSASFGLGTGVPHAHPRPHAAPLRVALRGPDLRDILGGTHDPRADPFGQPHRHGRLGRQPRRARLPRACGAVDPLPGRSRRGERQPGHRLRGGGRQGGVVHDPRRRARGTLGDVVGPVQRAAPGGRRGGRALHVPRAARARAVAAHASGATTACSSSSERGGDRRGAARRVGQRAVREAPRSEYKKRKYRVQYGEIGLRLPEPHAGGRGRHVLTSSPREGQRRCSCSATRRRPPKRAAPSPSATAQRRRSGARHRGARRPPVRPGKYTMRDHDYRAHPSYKLVTTAEGGRAWRRSSSASTTRRARSSSRAARATRRPADDAANTAPTRQRPAKLAQKRLDAKRGDAKTSSPSRPT